MSGPVANVTGNPYTDFRLYLVDLMYPAPPPGHLIRLNALTALLAVTIALAFVYAGTNVRNSRREAKQVWLVRTVQRPQGRYLITNQSFVYPLGVIIACSVWLAYLSRTRSWWYHHTSASTAFYWITLSSLPAFLLSYSTTLSYLASSNVLSAHHSTPFYHPLSPKLSNTLFATLPILLVPMYITSIRCGSSFGHVFALWQDLELELAGSADTWSQSLVSYGDMMMGLKVREMRVLHAPYRDFVAFHRTSVGVDLGCFAVLLFLNLAGIALLVTVRKKAESRSATTTPLPPSPPPEVELDDLKAQSEHRISIASIITASTLGAPVEGKQPTRRTGHRLAWDITLFYFGVTPIAALYVAYGSWVLATSDLEFGDFGTLELASFWVPWAYAGIASASLLAVLLKRTLSPPPPKALPPLPLPSLQEMRASLSGGSRRRSRGPSRDGVLDK